MRDKYQFARWVPMQQVGEVLVLALMAVEDLYGASVLEADAWRCCDEDARVVWIDPTTEAGSALSRLFAGLIRRSFGHTAYVHSRVQVGKEVA